MSKKMIYQHNSGDGIVSSHELEVTKNEMNDCRMTIKYDKNDQNWTKECRGKTAGKLKDHGNGITIKLSDHKNIELDYSQVWDVMMLLKFYDEDSGCMDQFQHTIRKLQEVE